MADQVLKHPEVVSIRSSFPQTANLDRVCTGIPVAIAFGTSQQSNQDTPERNPHQVDDDIFDGVVKQGKNHRTRDAPADPESDQARYLVQTQKKPGQGASDAKCQQLGQRHCQDKEEITCEVPARWHVGNDNIEEQEVFKQPVKETQDDNASPAKDVSNFVHKSTRQVRGGYSPPTML